MTFRKHWWLLIPLAAALGCAGSEKEQKVAKAGGNSTLTDEGPALPTHRAQARQRLARPEPLGLQLWHSRPSSSRSRAPMASRC